MRTSLVQTICRMNVHNCTTVH